MILAGDLLEARADQTIVTHFTITLFTVTKNQLKVGKHTDYTTAFRRTIALVDDIILRCNQSTIHVEWSVGASQGIEIAPANEFHDFRGLSPPPASLFWKMS